MNKNNLKDIAYIIFIISMLLSNFYNNYINQLRFDKMEANFLHVLKTNQEKFDRIQEMNLRMFKYILTNQTKKTPVVENINQTNPLLSESTQNNITTFISDNSTTILAVSAVLLAIGIYCYWQPINAWFLSMVSYFNNKPKDDDDNKGNGGGSSDIGGNNNGGGSNNDVVGNSYIGGNNDVADSTYVGECSSNAIIPYNEQSGDLQAIIDLITPDESSSNLFTLTNRIGEMVTVDLSHLIDLFSQIYVKNGTPFVRYLDNTEQPLIELKIEDLESLLDYDYTYPPEYPATMVSENLGDTTEHHETISKVISDLIEIICKENL
jgi:hypothetical protein